MEGERRKARNIVDGFAKNPRQFVQFKSAKEDNNKQQNKTHFLYNKTDILDQSSKVKVKGNYFLLKELCLLMP